VVVVSDKYRLNFAKVETRGFAIIGSNVTGSFKSRQLMIGNRLRSPEYQGTKNFPALFESAFLIEEFAVARLKTDCGEDVRVKFHAQLELKKINPSLPPSQEGSSFLSLDTRDIGSPNIEMLVQLESCR